jgi:NAD(P)-dependent dehydrogenase (short-subunit alcohol dehydrogenase family)
MDLGLSGRRALVAGASRGLGRAVSLELAAEGAAVVAVARNLDKLRDLSAASPAQPGSITPHVCDLADATAIGGLADSLPWRPFSQARAPRMSQAESSEWMEE